MQVPNHSAEKVNSMKSSRTIKVDYLARVEGEGALSVKIKDGQVTECKLKIFEPPRFFEAFLRDRKFTEVPDITARICGICPIAYQMSSSYAMENALGITVDGQLRELRRLIYCGEWIESHILHAFMLHAPDFLGYQDAIRMAADHPDEVKLGLKLKKLGNDLMTTIGGREIHPVNVRVGGFHRPRRRVRIDCQQAGLAPVVHRFPTRAGNFPFGWWNTAHAKYFGASPVSSNSFRPAAVM